MKKMKKTIYHSNMKVSYWSVCRNAYVQFAAYVPKSDLVVMPETERNRIVKHLRLNRRSSDNWVEYEG